MRSVRQDGGVPRYTRPAGMPPDVEALIDVIGNRTRQALLRELARVNTASTAQLQAAVCVRRESVVRHLRLLEDAGLVRADIPRGVRFGASPTWTLIRPNLIAQLEDMRDYLTGR